MLKFNKRIVVRYFFSAVCLLIALFLLVSLVTYSRYDVTWLYTANDIPEKYANYTGSFGATVAAMLLYLFGAGALLFVPLLVLYTLFLVGSTGITKARIIAFIVFIIATAAQLYAAGYELFGGVAPGGVVGYGLYWGLARLIDKNLVPFILMVMMWAAALIFLQFYWARFVVTGFTGLCTMILQTSWCSALRRGLVVYWNNLKSAASAYTRAHYTTTQTLEELVDAVVQDSYSAASVDFCEESFDPVVVSEPLASPPAYASSEEVVQFDQLEKPFVLPPRALFKTIKHATIDKEYQKECRARAAILENKLERFGLMGSIVSITIGPVVTLYEYQPEIDVKVSKIVALEDDLALALEAHSLRIIAPMPGKAVIGFEVAYGRRMTVHFSTLVHSKAYKECDAALPLVLGQDTVGDPVIIDLVGLPHVLVAGSTGSGKSVALHTMLVSLLCAKTPDELKLVIIDPKRLEFSAYADCAHLLFPIIIDAPKAVAACNYVLGLMEERYTRMAAAGVRTINDYNTAHPDNKIPYIVILIDELADLMMTTGKEIESVLARLAQMARAAGIHLIVATQRPSVDVITGLIKANFPARISFKVASKIDSRTILDIQGAEKLLGKGDMLFLNAQGMIRRVHGAFLTEPEIEAVATSIKKQRSPAYIDLTQSSVKQQMDPEDEQLYKEIILFLGTIDDISISLLQRQFRIGYNRSARIIQILEAEGRIMTVDGGKTRRVVK